MRERGPADLAGLRPGDTLIGLGSWETKSPGNVEFAIHMLKQAPTDLVKFFIRRNGEMLYGRFSLASPVKYTQSP